MADAGGAGSLQVDHPIILPGIDRSYLGLRHHQSAVLQQPDQVAGRDQELLQLKTDHYSDRQQKRPPSKVLPFSLRREVSSNEAAAFAEENHMLFMECSAKDNALTQQVPLTVFRFSLLLLRKL